MIIDKLLQISDDQAVTATAASTDVIDFGQATPNTGMTDRLHMVITVGEKATAAGAATVTFTIQDSANNSAFTDVAASAAVGLSGLVAGAQIVIPMPLQHRRYVRLNYTIGTGPLTAGKFSAQVVAGLQLNTPLPGAPL